MKNLIKTNLICSICGKEIITTRQLSNHKSYYCDDCFRKVRTCYRKELKFKTLKAAKNYIKSNLKSVYAVVDVQVYKCKCCNYYHIAHKHSNEKTTYLKWLKDSNSVY